MTNKATKKGKTKANKTTFKCKFCEANKPLAEMVIITRYFPPIVACPECERRLR